MTARREPPPRTWKPHEIVCCECRKPSPTMALHAKGGYADGPRPAHGACFDASPYLRSRFVPAELRGDEPWLANWKVS